MISDAYAVSPWLPQNFSNVIKLDLPILNFIIHVCTAFFAVNSQILRVGGIKFIILHISNSRCNGLRLFWLVIPVLESFQSTIAYQYHVI